MKYVVRYINIHLNLVLGATGAAMQTIDEFENQILEHLRFAESQNSKLYLLIMDVNEGRVYLNMHNKQFNDLRKLMQKYCIDYKFICDGDQEDLSCLINLGDIIYVNYFSLVSYVHAILDDDQIVNEVWNHNATLGLFTPGHIERYHRVVLLSKLWERGLTSKLMWSFCPTPRSIDIVRKHFLANYDEIKLSRFVSECYSVLDYIPLTKESEFNINGFPYDHSLYKNTLFSVLAETDFAGQPNGVVEWVPKITEKTYRAIINRHPFVVSWHKGLLRRFEKEGYNTFEEYMVVQNYNDIADDNERMEATIQNIASFTNIKKDKKIIENINRDIEHNFNHYLSIVNRELDKLCFLFALDQHPTLKMGIVEFIDIASGKYRNTGHIASHLAFRKA